MTVSKVAQVIAVAVVRGTGTIDRLLKLTRVEDVLVLVDDPDDLVPPPEPG